MKNYRRLLFLIVLYCVGKILKNSLSVFENGSEGGFWNVIILVLEMWAMLYVIGNGKIAIKRKSVFTIGFFYSLFAIMNSLININSVSVSVIYNSLTLPYFILVAYLSFKIFQDLDYDSDIKDIRRSTSTFVLIITGLITASLLYIVLFNTNSSATSNVYYLLLLFPMLHIANNKKVTIIYFVLLSISIIISNKRGALVGFVVCIVIFSIVNSFVSQRLLKKLSCILLLATGSVAFVLIFSKLQDYFDITLLRRLRYIVDNRTLGVRSDIYETIFRALKNSSCGELIFGHGLKTVTKLFGAKGWQAHNDFLQVLYELGALPFICLIIFYIRLIKESFFEVINKKQIAPYYVYITIMSLFVSMMSYYVITTEYVTIGMTSLGFLKALSRKENANEYS